MINMSEKEQRDSEVVISIFHTTDFKLELLARNRRKRSSPVSRNMYQVFRIGNLFSSMGFSVSTIGFPVSRMGYPVSRKMDNFFILRDRA